ncbi:MAG: hypothetical protein IJO46_06680, partial [Thermoguttaceae bacterium]|nr:hypothetical protein [Thermoguttaceae bacterium]
SQSGAAASNPSDVRAANSACASSAALLFPPTRPESVPSQPPLRAARRRDAVVPPRTVQRSRRPTPSENARA